MYYLVTIHLVTRGTSRSHATYAYICFMAGRISTDEETLRKKVLWRFRRWSPLVRKGFWGRSFEASICEKIAAIAASSILNFVGSLSDLCIHPVHPGHILDIRSRLIGRSTNFCKEISIVRTFRTCCMMLPLFLVCYLFMYVYVWSLGWVFKPICWAAWVPSVRVFVLKCIRLKWSYKTKYLFPYGN